MSVTDLKPNGDQVADQLVDQVAPPGPSEPAAFDPSSTAAELIGHANRGGGPRLVELPPPPAADPPATSTQAPRGRGRPRKDETARDRRRRLSNAAKRANETRKQTEQPKPAESAPASSPASPIIMSYAERAEIFNGQFFMVATMLFGDEMVPTGAEKTRCDVALAETLKRSYPNAMPRPELIMLAAYGDYIMPRIQRPSVKDRARGLWAGMKSLGENFLARFKRRSVNE